MFYYGGNTAAILTRDILRCILNELAAAKKIGTNGKMLNPNGKFA